MRGGRAAAAVLLLAWALLGVFAPEAAGPAGPPGEHRAAAVTVPAETAGEPVPYDGDSSCRHAAVRAPRAAGGPDTGRGTGSAPAWARAVWRAAAGPRPPGAAADGPGAGRGPRDVTELQTFRC
ncbi:hypothetical protein [Streptomyces sp. enrichment culture]|uniref:hypothetical protein n=1 Tax=Streptomyces sp. enrichment culture TaxID=1795815 RepID=UPI003F561A51